MTHRAIKITTLGSFSV